MLVIALAYVTVYVLTSNTIKDRKAKIATVQTQVTAAQAAAARLATYVNFTKIVSNRDATVRQIATQRFDWDAALSDLSKVVPANTSLQSLLGTVSPAASINGAGGSSGARRRAPARCAARSTRRRLSCRAAPLPRMTSLGSCLACGSSTVSSA